MKADEYNLQKSLNLIIQQLEILKQTFIQERKLNKKTKNIPDTQRMLFDLLKENFKYNNPSISEKEVDDELIEEIRMMQLTDNTDHLKIYDD